MTPEHGRPWSIANSTPTKAGGFYDSQNPPGTNRIIASVMRHKHGRPRKYADREQMTVRLDAHEMEQLRRMAAQLGLHIK
jgi:hypothetical protein